MLVVDMIGWLVLALIVAVFLTVMTALWNEASRALSETDERCSRVDEDLGRRVGSARGWRN